jgi:hypothetical protein
MQITRWKLLWLVPLCAIGCSQPRSLSTVEGKVLVKQEPAEGVLVTFHRKGADAVTTVNPSALTDKDGAFSLATGTEKGAPAGEYAVTFFWPKDVKARNPLEGTDTKDGFAGQYVDATRSTFKVEIKPGPNKLEPFNLK